MLSLETAATFFAASVLLALSPGPDNIFVLTNSSIAGKRAGLLVTIGLCTGLLLHTAVVVLGLAAILLASPFAFTLVRFAGAFYLVYLAWQAWSAPAVALDQAVSAPAAHHWYVRGVVMNVTNPKVLVFFLAFLPQFVVARDDAWWQSIQLGALFILATLIVFGSIALLAGTLGEHLRRAPNVQIYLNRFAALVFVALALRLVLPSH